MEKYLTEMSDLTSKPIQIPSVRTAPKPGMPFGEPIAQCLSYALEVAEKLGFRTQNVDNYAGYAEVGEGDEMIGILVHLDVVPAGEGWQRPPFSGIIENGEIHGRGAYDDKGAVAMILYAIRSLMDQGFQWKKRVRVIFGCDEESNWEDMAYYKAHCEYPTFGFVPDAMFPLIYAEKGLFQFELLIPPFGDDSRILSLEGGEQANVVLAKSYAVLSGKINHNENPDIILEQQGENTHITSIGLAAHGSAPNQGRNAGTQLMALLHDNGLEGNFINAVCNLFGNTCGGEGFRIACSDEASGALTLSIGVLEKLDNDYFRVVADMRYPVTADSSHLIQALTEKAALYQSSINVLSHKQPLYFPEDHPLIQALMDAYFASTGRKDRMISIGGSTYARSMPNLVAFGPAFPGSKRSHNIHKPDEFIGIDELKASAEVYEAVIRALQNIHI